MNRVVFRALSLLIAVSASAPLLAGIGVIDPAFGDGGQLKAGLIAVLPDGKLLVTAPNGYVRTMPDGKTDTTFGLNGLMAWPAEFTPASWVNWRESLIATNADGSTLVAGYVSHAGSRRLEGAVARLRPDGGIDANFGQQGIVRLPLPDALPIHERVHMPEAVTIQPDGRILILSLDYTQYWEEIGTGYLQRLESDGRRDPAFGASGELKPDISMSEVMGTRIQYLRDGRFKLGDATYLDSLGRLQAAAAASGIPDITNPGWITVGQLPGGDSIVAWLRYDAGIDALRIARLDAAGRPVTSFGPQGTGMADTPGTPGGMIVSSSVSRDGRYAYFATAWQNPVSPAPNFSISRFLLDGPGSGLPDPSFGTSGQVVISPVVTGSQVARIVAQPGGASIVGGYLRTMRLMGTAGFSAGVIGPNTWSWTTKAGASRIELVFSRSGGIDGAVGFHYETYSAPATGQSDVLAAVAGTDYTPRSGTVEWADGDGSDKSIFIEILPGGQTSMAKVFHVRMDQASGGGFLSTADSTVAIVAASAVTPPASSAPTQSSPGPAAPGGGGALDLLMLLTWLSMLCLAKRSDRATTAM